MMGEKEMQSYFIDCNNKDMFNKIYYINNSLGVLVDDPVFIENYKELLDNKPNRLCEGCMFCGGEATSGYLCTGHKLSDLSVSCEGVNTMFVNIIDFMGGQERIAYKLSSKAEDRKPNYDEVFFLLSRFRNKSGYDYEELIRMIDICEYGFRIDENGDFQPLMSEPVNPYFIVDLNKIKSIIPDLRDPVSYKMDLSMFSKKGLTSDTCVTRSGDFVTLLEEVNPGKFIGYLKGVGLIYYNIFGKEYYGEFGLDVTKEDDLDLVKSVSNPCICK